MRTLFYSLGEENKHPDYQAKGNLLTSKSFGDKCMRMLEHLWWTCPIMETGGRVGRGQEELQLSESFERGARGRTKIKVKENLL